MKRCRLNARSAELRTRSLVIYPAVIAAELGMTGRDKNGGTVTRAFLREAIYRSCTGLSRRQADEILEATFAEICDALAQGETVKLRSFGAFSVRCKRTRVGRNPKTGIEALITARRVLNFSASPVLVAKVNGETNPENEE
jgi:integration host factor subunit alpha